jgi:sortase A
MLRVVLHFVASVMMVSGTLLIADAGITLAWQEPISAFMAEQEQGSLEKKLKKPAVVKRVLEKQPLEGDAIGKIELPEIGKSYFVVEGTDTGHLRKGPGHYPETPLPGERGTVGIAGHRTTYGAPFRNIDDLERGDEVMVEMPYGTFVYRVQRVRIVPADALWVTKRVGYQRLILSACHPLYSARQRIVVFAKLARRERARVAKS